VRSRDLVALRRVAPELPTFDEALALFAERSPGVGLHVDLKWTGLEGGVVDALRAHGLVERTLVSTPVAASLRRVAELEPGLAVGLTYPFDRRGVSQRRLLTPLVIAALGGLRRTLPRRLAGLLAGARASVAVLQHRVISPAVVGRAHAAGVPVVAWTVDDVPTVERLAAAGVDAIVTNDPQIVRATLSE
jgi:glycerophosphoryl diester phosphodiesterase